MYKRQITGYVIEVTDKPEYDPARTKPLIGIKADSVAMEAKLIALAAWIRRNYGSTMNQALTTVIPVKKQAKAVSYTHLHPYHKSGGIFLLHCP